MRKVFAGALIFSVIGAVILGGTLAWQNSKLVAANQTVDVGILDWGSVYIQNSDALLGPNGYQNQIGIGSLVNSGEFNLAFLGGQVVIRNVATVFNPGSGHGSCDADNFSGSVEPLVPAPNGYLSPGESLDDAYVVKMTVHADANTACMGATVTYDLYVTVGTLGNSPGDF
jgi:hypothetical protein